jgi:hypothetical protein
MSLTENQKRSFLFSLGLIFSLFSFTSVFANYTVDYYGYDNDVLTLKISYPNQNGSYDKIIFPTVDMGNFFYFWQYNYGITDLDSTSANCGDYSAILGSQYSSTYCIIAGQNITFTFSSFYKYGQGMKYASPISKTFIDSQFGVNYLENVNQVPTSQANFIYYLNSSTNSVSAVSDSSMTDIFPFGSITPPVIEGVCGSAQNQTLTTIPPENSYACGSGTMINFSAGYTNELQVELRYDWLCEGSGGGSSTACYSAIIQSAINGTCGTGNGQEFSTIPLEYERCETGSSHGSLLETLGGWTWSCYGFNGGQTASCSAIYTEITTPPIIPDTSLIPTPTDCDTYSGIDKVLCNFGNTIQGMFLPSTEKITELQNTLNNIGNVFPFNYLRAIGSVFSNANITQGTLTMSLLGTTGTLNPDFFDMPIFPKVRLFFTIMVLLMFTFWAINYIKHFFK